MKKEDDIIEVPTGLDDILNTFGETVNTVIVSETVSKKRGRAANDTFEESEVKAAFERASVAVKSLKNFAQLDGDARRAELVNQFVIQLASHGYTMTQCTKALSFKLKLNEKSARAAVLKAKTAHLQECVRTRTSAKVHNKYISWAITAHHKYQKGTLEIVDCSGDKVTPQPSRYRVSSKDTVWGPTQFGFDGIELRERQLEKVRGILNSWKDDKGTFRDDCPLTEDQRNAPRMLQQMIDAEVEKFWAAIEKAESDHRKVFPVQRERQATIPTGADAVAFFEELNWDSIAID